MADDALRSPTMGGTIGCLGTALVHLLGGVIDFNTVDGFEIVLETGLTLVLVNVEGLGGSRGTERTDKFKQALPSDVDT